jgi:hypothetical protein
MCTRKSLLHNFNIPCSYALKCKIMQIVFSTGKMACEAHLQHIVVHVECIIHAACIMHVALTRAPLSTFANKSKKRRKRGYVMR